MQKENQGPVREVPGEWTERRERRCISAAERRGGEQTHNEAKGKERVALDDPCGHVPAVVALAHDTLVARDLLAEGMLSADEEEEHGCDC